MIELNRIQVDKFKLEDSLSFEDLENNKNNIDKFLIRMEEVFKNLSKIHLEENKRILFLNGVKLKVLEKFSDGVYNIYCENYIGLGIVENGYLKRDIVEKEN